MIIFLGLTLIFNFAQAVILADSGNNIGRIASNISNYGLGVIFLLSFPLFITGVYKLCKDNKKKGKKLSVLSLISKIVLALLLSILFFAVYGFTLIFVGYSLDKQENLITPQILFAFYVFGSYFYLKGLSKFLKLNFLIMLSILFFVVSRLIYYLIIATST